MEKNKFVLNQEVYALNLIKEEMACPVCNGKLKTKVKFGSKTKEIYCLMEHLDRDKGTIFIEQYKIVSGKISKIKIIEEIFLDENKNPKKRRKISYYLDTLIPVLSIEDFFVNDNYEIAKAKMLELNKQIIDKYIEESNWVRRI